MAAHNETVAMCEGDVYGRLTVQKQHHECHEYRDKRGWLHRIILWVCFCECGREVIAQGRALRSGNTTSCKYCRRHEAKIKRYAEHNVERDWHGYFVRWVPA